MRSYTAPDRIIDKLLEQAQYLERALLLLSTTAARPPVADRLWLDVTVMPIGPECALEPGQLDGLGGATCGHVPFYDAR